MSHIFYKIRNLSLEAKTEIIRDAMNVSTKWWVDEKGRESWQRQKIEMSFDEIMSKFDDSCHFVVIHRIDNFLNI